MTNGTGGVFGRGSSGTVREAFIGLQQSDRFREYPLQVRIAFQRVATWLPPRQASLPITEINASFAKMLRDKAARERGWKFGNYALLLLQAIVKVAVEAGTLPSNRVKQVPKLAPVKGPPSRDRRQIKPIRGGLLVENNLAKAENSTA
jgi:hypothetical protein